MSIADLTNLRAALAKIDAPISIRSLANIIHEESILVAHLLHDFCREGETQRLVIGEKTYYWPTARPLPDDWQGREHDGNIYTPDPVLARATKALKPVVTTDEAPQATTQQPGATMPTPLTKVMAKTLAIIAAYPNGISTADCADSLGINRQAVSKRLEVLQQNKLIQRKGHTTTSRWFAVAQNTSTAAPSEAKMPETPRQQTTLKTTRKASLETLDATLRNKKARRTAGPAIIDGINTRELLELPGADDSPAQSIAITDRHQLLILTGHKIEQVIEQAAAKRLVAFLRTLDPQHELAIAS